MVLNYRIIEAQSLSKLTRKVKYRLSQGWSLRGGVSGISMYSADGSFEQYFQAMVKKEMKK